MLPLLILMYVIFKVKDWKDIGDKRYEKYWWVLALPAVFTFIMIIT